MTSTTLRHLTLLACLAAPAAACAPVEGEPDVPGDAPGAPPDDAPAPASPAGEALQLTGTQAARARAVAGTATDNVTLEAWIRWDGNPTLQAIAYNGDSSSSGYGLYVLNGNPRVLVGGKGFVRCSGCVLAPGAWTHVAAVRSAGTWAIYQDGVAGALTGTPTLAPAAPAGMLSVGSSPTGGESFHGALDEVRAWSVARTAQELARDRTAALRGDEAGLEAYYRLDEGEGSVARDATSQGRDLDLHGGPMWIRSGAPLTAER